MSAEAFLDGRVAVRQPQNGHRAGLDAVMLAAAVPARAGERALELGAGAGTASLCLAARIADVDVTGLEIDPALVRLARENADANFAEARVKFVTADLFSLPGELRVEFDQVFCNPPFHETGLAPTDPVRARALHDEGRMKDWLAAGLKRVKSDGIFTVILAASRMTEALAILPERGVRIFPLFPRAGQAAKRIILWVHKGSRESFMLLPGLILHEANGRYTPAADAVLRDGAALTSGGAPTP